MSYCNLVLSRLFITWYCEDCLIYKMALRERWCGLIFSLILTSQKLCVSTARLDTAQQLSQVSNNLVARCFAQIAPVRNRKMLLQLRQLRQSVFLCCYITSIRV